MGADTGGHTMADATGSPPSPGLRRRPRLSLRGLMLLVLVVGGGLGYFDLRARAQRDAVAAVERAGGQVRYDLEADDDGKPTPWARWRIALFGIDRVATVVDVRGGPGFDDATMAAVARLMSLEQLELGDCPVTDAGLAAGLAGLGRLKRLEFHDGNSQLTRAIIPAVARLDALEKLVLRAGMMTLDDADLGQLARLRRLREVSLRGPAITDAGLDLLATLPALEHLHLELTGVTEVGLGYLARCKTLRSLFLVGAEVKTLEPLRNLPNLESITVWQCPLASAWTTPVAGLDRLKALTLPGAPIRDAGLAHLGGLPALENLDLQQSRLTDAGLAHVGRCARLVELNVADTAITTLEPIRAMPRLIQIVARGCPISVAWKTPVTGLGALWSLDLSGAPADGAGLARLGDLGRVTSLSLSGSKADNSVLAAIGPMKGLAHLNLAGTAITDAGLAHLANLAGLVTLELSRTDIGDAAIPHLLRIPGAPFISLSRTGITDAGLRKLDAPGGFRGVLNVGGPSLTAEGVRAAQAANPGIKIMVEPTDPPPPAPAGEP